MDFYQQQTQARRQSRILVFIYLLGTLALGLVSSLWLSLILLPFSHHQDPQGSRYFLTLAIIIMLACLFVTMCRYQTLSKGGWRVAKALGGRRLLPSPAEFKEQQLQLLAAAQDDRLTAAIRAAEAGEIAEAVNFNDPAQTVIAGTRIGVERACEALKAAGAKRALMLPVSAPFHSSLMKPAADKLRQRLAETSFAAPQIPVINNIDVVEQADPEKIRDALYRQAFGPVRWVECVQAIVARGVGAVVECGPGKALTGMNKRIDAGLQALPVSDPQTLTATLATLQTT